MILTVFDCVRVDLLLELELAVDRGRTRESRKIPISLQSFSFIFFSPNLIFNFGLRIRKKYLMTDPRKGLFSAMMHKINHKG